MRGRIRLKRPIWMEVIASSFILLGSIILLGLMCWGMMFIGVIGTCMRFRYIAIRPYSIHQSLINWLRLFVSILQKSNKFDGSNHQSLVKEKFEQLNGLAVFHKANQPITRKNHCKDSDCSHICTLTPTSYKCKCPVGMYLDRRNKRTCSGKTDSLTCEFIFFRNFTTS